MNGRQLSTELSKELSTPDGTAPNGAAASAKSPFDERVDTIARAYWDAADPKPLGRGAWFAVRNTVAAALKAGWPDAAVAAALPDCPTVSNGALELALNRRKRHPGGPARAQLLAEDCEEVRL